MNHQIATVAAICCVTVAVAGLVGVVIFIVLLFIPQETLGSNDAFPRANPSQNPSQQSNEALIEMSYLNTAYKTLHELCSIFFLFLLPS